MKTAFRWKAVFVLSVPLPAYAFAGGMQFEKDLSKKRAGRCSLAMGYGIRIDRNTGCDNHELSGQNYCTDWQFGNPCTDHCIGCWTRRGRWWVRFCGWRFGKGYQSCHCSKTETAFGEQRNPGYYGAGRGCICWRSNLGHCAGKKGF